MHSEINRLVYIKGNLASQPFANFSNHAIPRRRVGCRHQESGLFVILRQGYQLLHGISLAHPFTVLGVFPGTIRIVKIQYRSLRKEIGSSTAPGHIRIAFNLGGAAFIGYGKKRNGSSPRGHGCRKMHWHAMYVILSITLFVSKRNNMFLRSATSHSQHARTGQPGRSAHQFQKITTRKVLGQFLSSLRKLTIGPVRLFHLTHGFANASPITRFSSAPNLTCF